MKYIKMNIDSAKHQYRRILKSQLELKCLMATIQNMGGE